jgi:C4-dicarboxylate transporter, DcuC family
VLLAAAFAIAGLAGQWFLPLVAFFDTFASEKFVVPICSAMGFAYALRHTGCDRDLVNALTAPLRRVRPLLLPGVCCVGFIVNIPVISQTSCAVCLGPVAVPLLRRAGYSPAIVAACLCLGASVGGELLNPGAPELGTVSTATKTEARVLAREYIPAILFPYAITAIVVFWIQSAWESRRKSAIENPPDDVAPGPVNPLRAAVPLVPLALLFLTGPPFEIFQVPKGWLVDKTGSYDGRLIGAAMLVGVLAAALAAPRKAAGLPKQFFEGAGYGFANVVSLIVVATAFGKAVEAAGLAKLLGATIAQYPDALVPLAAAVPWAFAAVSGSGMASTQSLYGFFYEPALQLGQSPESIGAVVSVGAAAGRTMSPAAAVVLMSASLTGVNPLAVVRRVALPLVLGLLVTVAWQAIR